MKKISVLFSIGFYVVTFLLGLTKITFAQTLQKKSINPLESYELEEVYDISNFIIAEDEIIYAVDKSTIEIVKLSNNGIVLAKIGGKGRGPNEFSESPSKIVYNRKEDLIAVHDRESLSIKYFTRDLKLSHEFKLRFPASDFDFDDNGYLITSSLLLNDAIDGVNIFSVDKKLISSFSPDIEKTNFLMDSFSVRSLSNNRILIVFNFRNIVQVYNYEGELLQAFSISGLPELAKTNKLDTKSSIIKEVPSNFIFQSITLDEEENLIALIGPYAESSFKDVYSINIAEEKVNSIHTLNNKGRYIFYSNERIYLESTNINISRIEVYSLN